MDPIRYAAGDVDLYRYESNSSLNSLDPSGLDGFEWLARRFNPSSVEESDRLDRQRAEQQSRRTEQEIPTQGLSMGSYDRMFGSTSSSMRQAGGYIDRIGGSVADGVLDGMTQLAPMFLSAKFVNGNKLCYDKGSKAWTSSGGLVYGQGSVHGNRVKHVLAHTVAQPNNPKHTVFKVATPGDVIGLLDRAWAKKKGTVPNDPMSYIIDMGEVIGTAGETKIKIVVNRGTSEIITAYPFK